MKNIISSMICVGLVVLTTACTPNENTRGNLISDLRYSQATPHETTRYELRQIWGPPTAVAPFSEGDTWYYIGQKTEAMGIFKKEIVDSKIVRVDFDAAGTVMHITQLDPETVADIKPNKRKTPTAGKEFTILQQLVGNLGKFNNAGRTAGGSGNN